MCVCVGHGGCVGVMVVVCVGHGGCVCVMVVVCVGHGGCVCESREVSKDAIKVPTTSDIHSYPWYGLLTGGQKALP